MHRALSYWSLGTLEINITSLSPVITKAIDALFDLKDQYIKFPMTDADDTKIGFYMDSQSDWMH